MAVTYTTAEVTGISGNTLVYTVPVGKTAIIMSALFGNTGIATSIVDIQLNGTSYAQGLMVAAEGQIVPLIERQILTAGQTIHVNAAGGNLSLRLSIKEI